MILLLKVRKLDFSDFVSATGDLGPSITDWSLKEIQSYVVEALF